jgi:two-component system OmpR family sensor kinase/two-component system sensor histidine kinase BaeS
MNRLWIRLSLAFSVVVLLGVAILVAASGLIARSGIRESIILDEMQTPGGLIDRLETYYHRYQSWDDFDLALSQTGEIFSIGPRLGLVLLILDTQGKVIFTTESRLVGQARDVAGIDFIAPVVVQGEIKGYVMLEEPTLEIPPRQSRLVLESLSTVLLAIGLTGGVVGVFFGVLMSRSLTAPLRRLAEAARAIGAQNLSRRVKVEGTIEVAEMAHAFNEMAEALEQTERLRRNLVADVAHELRTPLTVLQGNLLAILDDVYPMDKSEVARLYDQTRLLSRLVNDLHELSQAEANQLPLNFQPVRVDELLNSTAARFESLAEADDVTLTVSTQADLPLLVADSGRLSQVLHNLLNNALVHTPKGGEITIHAERSDDQLKLSVKDTGEGISPEHLPFIFERFYRVDASRDRNTGGTGLGLAIVKAIVEAHGGHIKATSNPGQGSTFIVELPLSKVSEVNASEDRLTHPA